MNCNSRGNVQIEQGALTLKTTYDHGEIMSGLVESKVYYKFNKVEIRAALPKGKLLRPTIILKTKGTYGSPKYGQIDMVVYNQEKLSHGVHRMQDGDPFLYVGNDSLPLVDLSKFNVYSIERTNSGLVFKMNNNDIWIYSYEDNYRNDFNPFNMSDGFKLMLNVGVGGYPDGVQPFFDGDQTISLRDAHDWMCSVMIVDYIKIVDGVNRIS